MTCSGLCASGWTEAFVILDSAALFALAHHTNGDWALLSVTPPGAAFSSAAAALTAYQAGPVSNFDYRIIGGVFTTVLGPDGITVHTSPFKFYDDGTSKTLAVPDLDGDRTNNFGGVSLRLTAVPEPASWGLAIAGLAMTGALLRRRRATTFA
jgi:hypothetical protein